MFDNNEMIITAMLGEYVELLKLPGNSGFYLDKLY